MIGIQAIAACFDRPVAELQDMPNVVQIPTAKARKAFCPASIYALSATRMLTLPSTDIPLFTISGSTGATVDAFDNAWRRSSDGTLTGGDFAQSRYKRIHPLTLIRSLQNQVPSVLSMELELTGPCLNTLDSACALVDLLPNINAHLQDHGHALVVMASAGSRLEEQTKHRAHFPDVPEFEGAVAIHLTTQAKGATLCADNLAEGRLVSGPPTLALGCALLRHLQIPGKHHLTAQDGSYQRTLCLCVS